MPTIADFHASPLFGSFIAPKYPDAIVGEILTMAEAELDEHRQCMGDQFDRITFLLTAHRLTKLNAAGLLTDPAAASVGVMSVSEMKQIVSSLSVSDEAGSESITFVQPNSSNSGIDKSSEDFASTQFGALYLTFFNKFRCPRSWMVA
jgi:hypothetical protein